MKKTFLMCQPTFYGVEYVINPHMEGNVGNVDHKLAVEQWKNLHSVLSSIANVELIEQAPGLPDMVFTANAGLIFHDLNYVWLSRFAAPQRRGEERLFAGWFMAYGLDPIRQPPANAEFFEGAGDGLVDHNGEYWLGYGIRSSQKAVETIVDFFSNRKFHLLHLKDPRFYHLDTCFAPLSKGHYMWYPEAFELASYWYVDSEEGGIVSSDMLIDVDSNDANKFACNCVCVDENIIIPTCSDKLVGQLKDLEYEVITVDLSEFIKAGGAAKCLTLEVC